MKILFTLMITTVPLIIFAQEKAKVTTKEREEFYNFLIPSSINGSSITPAAISNFNLGFGDNKTSLKYGRAFKRPEADQEPNESDDLKNSYSLSIGAKATDGLSVLYKKGGAVEFEASGGLTLMLQERRWIFTKSKETSTESYLWLNVTPKYSTARYNIFSTDTIYEKRQAETFSIMVNLNYWWHSEFEGAKLKNGIYSIGVGFGKINNYKTLNEISKLTGTAYTSGTSNYFVKSDETSGRKGSYMEYYAFMYTVDIYKALIRQSKITWYVGGRLNGLIGEVNIVNANAGFYFSFRDEKKKDEKFGFALTGNIDNLQGVSNKNSFNDKFYIALSANVPLKFNLAKKK